MLSTFDISIFQMAAIGLILTGGCFIQSVVGFGFGLFVMPLLTLAGNLSIPNAIGLMAAAGSLQSLLSIYHLRRHADWKKLLPLLIFGIIGLQLGVWILSLLQKLDKDTIQQVVGGFLLAILMVQIFWKTQPRPQVHIFWGMAALTLSGLLSGLVGMGGPFIVLWALAHQWPNQKTRVTILIVIGVTIPFQLSFLVNQFGWTVARHIGYGMLFLPIALAGTAAGLWIGNRIPSPLLRQFVLVILFVIAGASIMKPWF